ncbi:MAG: penicillin-binding protein [Patescibacteria group bacterium]
MPQITSYRKGKQTGFGTKLKLYWVRRKYRKSRGKKIFKKVLVFFIWIIILTFIGLIGLFAYFAKDLPNPEELAERRVIESTKIYDRTGQVLLYDVHGEEKRTVISFEEISQYIKDATLVIEDTNFYHHFGLDFRGIIRAFLANLQGKRVGQGGSTITQQLIKNTILTKERTLARKIKEAILAIELEIKYSKDEIFGFYLNQVPYGSNAYGIEAASQTFFNKGAKDLTLAESALLSALPQAPSYYSPYGSHFNELKARQEYILDRMYKFGYITEKELNSAKQDELKLIKTKEKFKAPHFVMYVKEYLEDKYGKEYIEKAGLKVYTSLDWELQQIAETIVAEQVKKNAKNYNAHNAALVAIDPKTGQILSMVGSKDYFAPDPLPKGCKPGKTCLFEPNFNVAIGSRQPGSSFKPFAYAKAFQKGFTPDTVVFDFKTEFNPNCPAEATQEKDQYGLDCYHPKNYDAKFRGPVTFREGLAQSLNVPSVKVLYLAGVNETINLAQDMGIETLKDRSRYGLSLVLGGGEVRLLEQTAAFGVFATEGIKNPLTTIIKIIDNKGKVVEEYKNKPKKIIEPQIARLISDILSDEEARAPIFGSKSNLYIEDLPTAAKTGTTQEYRDGWTIGYTPSLVVGVWAGNNDNTPMNKEPGLIVAAPIWNQFMKQAYSKKQETRNKKQEFENYFDLPEQIEQFTKPEPIITDKDILNSKFANEFKVKIDKISGKLATNLTPPNLIEERIYPQVHCILYYINKDDPQGTDNGTSDPQFNNWEEPVLSWANLPGRRGFYNQQPPQEYDDVHLPENQPRVLILSPYNNQDISTNYIKIEAEASARLGIEKIEFFFDDNLIGTRYVAPYYLFYEIPPDIIGGNHTIDVRVFDIVGNSSYNRVKINLFSPNY